MSVGKLYFSVFQGSFVIPEYLAFLKRLIRQNQGRKVILIVDDHPLHKPLAVKEWLGKSVNELEIYLLPGYSPELNPDECYKRLRPRNDLKAKLYEMKKQPKKYSPTSKAGMSSMPPHNV